MLSLAAICHRVQFKFQLISFENLCAFFYRCSKCRTMTAISYAQYSAKFFVPQIQSQALSFAYILIFVFAVEDDNAMCSEQSLQAYGRKTMKYKLPRVLCTGINYFFGESFLRWWMRASPAPLMVMKIDDAGEKWLLDGCIDKWYTAVRLCGDIGRLSTTTNII